MGLVEELKKKSPKIVKKWQDSLIASYPEDTQRFLKKEKDEFANPVGYIFKNELERLYNGFVDEDQDKINSSLMEIIRVRAVQDFFPSTAINFILELKEIIKDETNWESFSIEEKEVLDKKIISLLLSAFDIYEQCRQKLYDLRVHEIKRHVMGLLKMANLIYEIPDPIK